MGETVEVDADGDGMGTGSVDEKLWRWYYRVPGVFFTVGMDDRGRRPFTDVYPHAEDLQGIGSSAFHQDAVSLERGKRALRC